MVVVVGVIVIGDDLVSVDVDVDVDLDGLLSPTLLPVGLVDTPSGACQYCALPTRSLDDGTP